MLFDRYHRSQAVMTAVKYLREFTNNPENTNSCKINRHGKISPIVAHQFMMRTRYAVVICNRIYVSRDQNEVFYVEVM